jgi:hypothetical protein
MFSPGSVRGVSAFELILYTRKAFDGSVDSKTQDPHECDGRGVVVCLAERELCTELGNERVLQEVSFRIRVVLGVICVELGSEVLLTGSDDMWESHQVVFAYHRYHVGGFGDRRHVEDGGVQTVVREVVYYQVVLPVLAC